MYCLILGWLIINELDGVSKQALLSKLEVLFQHLLGKTGGKATEKSECKPIRYLTLCLQGKVQQGYQLERTDQYRLWITSNTMYIAVSKRPHIQ
jgi:hypothetical protein